MNTVDKIAIQLKARNEDFVRELYSRWDAFVEENLIRIADRVLTRRDETDTVIEITRLEVDLGSIREELFDRNFPLLFEEKLEEALLKSLLYGSGNSIRRRAEAEHLAELLFEFLLKGSLPWHISDKYRDIGMLFRTVMQTEAARLRAFLQTYGHYTSLQQRLVYQLDDRELEEGIRLLAPGESTFIQSYVRFLRAKYRQLEQPDIRETDHRNAVWQVVYAYLLNNQSSWFNRKRFVMQTIARLASHYNLSYESLLAILANVPSNLSGFGAIPPGLFMLIAQLQQEIVATAVPETATDAEEWYRYLSTTWNAGHTIPTGSQRLKALIVLLSREDSAYRLLKQMQEVEILRLVKLVIPQESTFVIAYAHSLDLQQEQGALQGKAGGEFRIFKWQVIFPLLLTANAASFNRKHLVWSVLKRIASRYNITIQELLAYLYRELEIHKVDRSLATILTDLYRETREQGNIDPLLESWEEADEIAALIRRGTALTVTETELLRERFSRSDFRESLLDLLNEKSRFFLLHVLFPKEERFLSAYALALDLQQQNGVLEGKTSGRLQRLKWTFIYDVLYASQHLSFNAEYIVSRVLQRMAAHYNVAYKELLTFFRSELQTAGVTFPFDLLRVLENLQEAQEPTPTEIVPSKTPAEQATQEQIEHARALLEQFFGNEALVRNWIAQLAEQVLFVRFIEPVLQVGEVLHRFLQTEWKISVSRELILRLLLRLAPRFQYLSQAEILQQLLQLFATRLSVTQQTQLLKQLDRLAATHAIITGLKRLEILASEQPEETGQAASTEANPENEEEAITGSTTYLSNAGLVLFSPFLPQLFARVGLVEAGKFIDRDAQIRGIFLLQYAVFGDQAFPEHEMGLNKLLTAFKTGIPIPKTLELTETEKTTVESMMQALIKQSGKLTNTSIAGLRASFLQRGGRLEDHDDIFLLTIEEKSYDLLLDTLPWNFKTIKYSWMPKAIHVKWR